MKLWNIGVDLCDAHCKILLKCVISEYMELNLFITLRMNFKKQQRRRENSKTILSISYSHIKRSNITFQFFIFRDQVNDIYISIFVGHHFRWKRKPKCSLFSSETLAGNMNKNESPWRHWKCPYNLYIQILFLDWKMNKENPFSNFSIK